MNAPLPPWAHGPFELLLHAEGHLQSGDDFDRRIALISFDNAIEVAIVTYLTLNPLQRGNRSYKNTDIEKWINNYYTKLDFIEAELRSRGDLPWQIEKSHILWAHDHRNEQYHGGYKGTPEKRVLEIIRKAGFWIFGLLFDVDDVESILEQEILACAPPAAPSPEHSFDVAIDNQYGIIEVGGQNYYASELLFAVDPAAYRELGGRLCTDPESTPPDAGG